MLFNTRLSYKVTLSRSVIRLFLFTLTLCFSIFSAEKNDIINCISGTIYLNSQNNIADSVKAQKYLELQKITGVNSEEMIAFIEKYRYKPEAWKKIEDAMIKSISIDDTAHTKK